MRLRLFLARLVLVASVAVCGLVALLLWNPSRWLLRMPLGLSPERLQTINFLIHTLPERPEYAWVLWWLILTGGLVAVVTRRHVTLAWEQPVPNRAAPATRPAAVPPGMITSRWVTGLLGTILLLQAGLWWSLARGAYHGSMVGLWIAGLGAVGCLGWRENRRAGIAGGFPFDRRECLGLGAVCAVFVTYCSVDLTSWRYSFMGDEFGFFTLPRFLASGRPDNWFGPGVDGYHPLLCSVYTSLFFRVLGPTVFAWRFSSVIAAMLALPAFYLVLRELIGQRVAVVGMLLLAGSHYLIVYAHHGINNVQVLFPTLLALALWLWGARRGNVLALALAGMAAGVGFYTFYSSRLAIGFLGLAFLLMPLEVSLRTRARWLGVVLLAFLITVAPLFAVPGDHFGMMLRQSALTNVPADPAVGFAARLWAALQRPELRMNWEACWLDPLYSPRPGRFMFGSWTDSWTGSWFLLGLVWALATCWRHGALRWVLACYFSAVIAVGVLHQYTSPPDTRMLFLVPFYLLFAALALEVIAQESVRLRLLSKRGALGFVAAAVMVSLAINQYRRLVTSPAGSSLSDLGLLVEVAQTYPQDRHLYFVVPPPSTVGFVDTLGEMYGFADRVEVISSAAIDAGSVQVVRPALILFPNMFPDTMDATLATLRARNPLHRFAVVGDGAGTSRLRIVELR